MYSVFFWRKPKGCILFVNFHDRDAWRALGLFICIPWDGRQGLTWLDSVFFLEEAKGMHG